MSIDALDCDDTGFPQGAFGTQRKQFVTERGSAGLARLVVVSNRVGVPDRGARAGGLEVAIRPALKRRGGVWFGWSGRIADDPGPAKTVVQDNTSYVTVDLRKDDYDEFYNGFANRVLWPILHYRLDLAEFTRRDLGGYFRRQWPDVVPPSSLAQETVASNPNDMNRPRRRHRAGCVG